MLRRALYGCTVFLWMMGHASAQSSLGGEGIERTFSMIHTEAQQKRKDGDRPDRVEGLIESRIQNRIRSRSYDFDR